MSEMSVVSKMLCLFDYTAQYCMLACTTILSWGLLTLDNVILKGHVPC